MLMARTCLPNHLELPELVRPAGVVLGMMHVMSDDEQLSPAYNTSMFRTHPDRAIRLIIHQVIWIKFTEMCNNL
jgi:hypothetical protein